MNCRPRIAFAFLALALFSIAASALEVPPPPSQWVTDTAGILPADEETRLNEKLRAFEERTGSQFIVYTLPSIEGGSIEDFTIRAAERWRVGQKKADNGLILFVFIQERKVRIEVGYGLEGTITDAVSAQTIRNTIGPHFQQGDYAAGLHAGADALMARIEGKEAPQPVRGTPGEARGQKSIWPFLILLLIFFFVLPMLGRSGCGCLPLFFFPGGGGGVTFGGGRGGFGGGGFGGGGFSGGGGGFGGGGATGGW